jgi:site-specific DNA-cytosine methylase
MKVHKKTKVLGEIVNELDKYTSNLPANIGDLTKFILIGREKLVAYRANIRAIDKIGLAKEVREQKMEEASLLAGALLDAEARMGELLKNIDKKPTETASGGRFGGSTKVLPEGITHKQSSAFQKLAENKDIIEQVKADAEEDDDLPTRTEVLRRIKVKETSEEKVDNKYEVKLSLYGENIYFNSSSCIENRWDDHIITEDTFPCLTRLGRFFHKNGLEFSLREYAQVQDFPDAYKFVGTYTEIKNQIGNAVSPKMAAYIGRKLKGTTVIDLFAGCGGLSLGLKSIGKKIVFANEYEFKYFQTYIANHPETECCLKNIYDLKELPDADIVVGGPPCQGFSSAGLRIKDDPRNKLYKEFLRIVDIKKPQEFLMENVPQIKEIKDDIFRDFEEIGYDVTFEIVNSLEIGMKQSRKRAFFIGNKK